MQRIGMPLLIHGELTDPAVDVFDREAGFIDEHLKPLLKRCPDLRVVFEHITTEEAVEVVTSTESNLAATITPHHLHINRNAMFAGGLRSDFYCLPVARERHRLALRRAATSGDLIFWGLIPRRTRGNRRRPPAVAPGSSMLPTHWRAMRKCLSRREHWLTLRDSPVAMGPGSIACR